MKVLATAALPLALLFTAPAQAVEEPFTLETFQVAAHLAGGFKFDGSSIDPYRLGVGGRFGITLESWFYLGGNLDWYFGESRSGTTENAWDVVGEGGVDLGLSPGFLLRPQIGLGFTEVRTCAGTSCLGNGSFTVQPGLVTPFTLGPVMLQPSVRMNIPTQSELQGAIGVLFGLGVGAALGEP